MKTLMMIFVGLIVLLNAASPATADTILNVDFEGMTVDQPVGTGGPEAGEPYSVLFCTAVVRNAPMSSQCLEIGDNSEVTSGEVNFSFLQDSEVESGTIDVTLNFRVSLVDQYAIYIREAGSATQNYSSVYLTSNGSISANDANGHVSIIGTYTSDQTYSLRILFDMDTSTYDMWLDGTLVVDDRAHGCTGPGIGEIICGTGYDENLSGSLFVDNIRIDASGITPVEGIKWGNLKQIYR